MKLHPLVVSHCWINKVTFNPNYIQLPPWARYSIGKPTSGAIKYQFGVW